MSKLAPTWPTSLAISIDSESVKENNKDIFVLLFYTQQNVWI